MTYLFKKFVRELRGMKFRGVLVVLSIGLSIGIYGGLLLVKDNAFASRSAVLQKTNYEDGRIILYNQVPESTIQNAIQGVNGIETIDYRLSVETTITVKNNQFPSVLHNINPNERPKVNDFLMKKGDFSSISNSLIVDQRFADANNLHVGDAVSVKYGNLLINTSVGALVFAPEHMYSTNPVTSLPEKGVFAPTWFSIDNFFQLLGDTPVVNEILIKVTDNSNLDSLLSTITKDLGLNGIPSTSVKGNEEIDYTLMNEDVGTLNEFAVAIGVVILFVAIFIIYDSITKIISSQTSMIGILRALGATSSGLLVHYMSFGLVLTLLGILIGIPIGYVITVSSTGIFVKAIGFEITANVFKISPFIPPILLAISVSLIASFIGTMKILFIRPVEAIDNQTIKEFSKGYFIERFSDKISSNKYSTKIPIRQVFQRKRRTLLTALTIAVAALIILSSFGFLDSFFHQMDHYYAHNDISDMEISFTEPISMQNLTTQLQQVQGISYFEGMIRQSAFVFGNSNNDSTVLYAFQANSKIRHYSFKEGNLIPGQVAIGQILARKLGVGVGDHITILTHGATKFDTVQLTLTISGITEEFFDNFVFLDLSSIQTDLAIPNMVNAVAINVNGQSSEVKQELNNSKLPISTIVDLKESKASFKALMEAVISFAYFVVALGVIVLILFSLNVIVLDVMERDREFINIKINGANNLIIAKIIGLQILLVSILVMIIDLFLSPVFTQFIIDSTMKNLAYMAYYMTPVSYLLSIIAFIGGLSIGFMSAVHNVTSANIVDSMRLRFKN